MTDDVCSMLQEALKLMPETDEDARQARVLVRAALRMLRTDSTETTMEQYMRNVQEIQQEAWKNWLGVMVRGIK